MIRRFLLILAPLCLFVASSVSAQQPTQTAEQFVRARYDEVNRVLGRRVRTPAETTARNAELDRLLADLLDYEELSHRALAQHWDARTPAERTEFVTLLKQLVERSYRRSLEGTIEYEVRYEGERPGTEADTTIVRTVASGTGRNRSQPEVAIEYTLHRVGGTWKIIDVTTDDVSMVRNYRSQFNGIMRRGGWEDLLRRMRERLAAGETPSP